MKSLHYHSPTGRHNDNMKDPDNTPPHPVQDLIIYPIQRNPQNSRQQKEKKQRCRISPEGEIKPFHSGEKLLKHIRAIQRRKRARVFGSSTLSSQPVSRAARRSTLPSTAGTGWPKAMEAMAPAV